MKNLVSELIFNTVKVVSHLVSESFKKIPIYSLVKVVKSRKNIRFWFCIKNSVFFNFKTFSSLLFEGGGVSQLLVLGGC